MLKKVDPSQRLLLNLLEVRLYILQAQNQFPLARVQYWDDTSSDIHTHSSGGVRKFLYLVISRFLYVFLALEQPRLFILLHSFYSLYCSQHPTFTGWVIYSFISCQLWLPTGIWTPATIASPHVSQHFTIFPSKLGKKVLNSDPLGPESVWGLHVLYVSAWILSVKNGWMMSRVDALLSTFTECFSVNKLKSIRTHCSFSLGPYFFSIPEHSHFTALV